jgi:DNA helicase HerA-like ATPase
MITKQRVVILIMGKQGSGKTTLAKRVIEKYPRIVVFDPLHEYENGDVITTLDEFAERMKENPKEFYLVLRFLGTDVKTSELMFEYASRIIWNVGDIMLVLEEAEIFLDSSDKNSFINYLISFGRHKGVSLVGIGRRPVELAIRLRSQFTSIVTFRQSEPNDLRYLEMLGFDSAEVASLGQYEFLTEGDDLENNIAQAEGDIFT